MIYVLNFYFYVPCHLSYFEYTWSLGLNKYFIILPAECGLQGTHLEKADCDHNTRFPANFDPIVAGVNMSNPSV
ncbi:MAG: hypothetical protein ACK5RT_11025 [Dolichospermum sp.]